VFLIGSSTFPVLEPISLRSRRVFSVGRSPPPNDGLTFAPLNLNLEDSLPSPVSSDAGIEASGLTPYWIGQDRFLLKVAEPTGEQ
jgi:hypothetical protein